jgi:UDP-N-acetylglucosamine 2-epimerase
LRVVTVIGNRPQFVKAAAVSRLLRAEHDELLVHTGQHHDDELSTIFVTELGVPRPERELGIHGGTNTDQTARMLAALGPLLAEERPDVVLVYGDTNSTLAGGLAAAQARIPVAHVEAGMRSFDRAMPEELNRVLTDHLSDVLLCPSATAVANLERERAAGRVELVGDVMVDIALLFQPRAKADDGPLRAAGVKPGEYAVATAHRAGNVDDPARLRALVDLLLAVPLPVVLPLHPRTRARLEAAGWLKELEGAANVRLQPPLGYVAFTALLSRARAVLTDSGGVQKEAYLAGVPCVTLRDTTEWVETVEAGWNVLVDLDAGAALAALERTPPDERPELYGDGHAGARVVAALSSRTPPPAA